MLVAVLLPAVAIPLHGETAARYEAMFVDGTRLEGDEVFRWGEHPGSPRLADASLFDAKRPLRWLRDRKLKAWRPSEYCPGYIEFTGGDRLVGHIEGVGSGDGPYVPEHLVVRLAASPDRRGRGTPRRVRILPGRIERVVFRPGLRLRLQPGTLYYRDGREVRVVHLRWKDQSVVLLLKDGTREVQMSDIAEVHLPRIDQWQAYYRELAVLSPGCRSRLIRIETTGGLIATGSSLRFGALAYGTDARRRSVEDRLRQLGAQLASIEGKRKGNQLKFDQARAKYHGQLAESEKQTKAAQQEYQKTVSDMRSGIDGQQKTDTAELAKRREKLTGDLRAAEQAMQKRLGKELPEKRDKMLETFRARQAQLRKSREKSLEDERIRIEARRKQKLKELRRFISDAPRKLKRQARELQAKTAKAEKEFERETVRWKKFLVAVESARSKYASARGGTNETWTHIVQPVWSLDSLWVPFRSICMRWSFAPTRVPLCRVRPASTLDPPFLPVRTNRSFAGGPLRSGGHPYAWGFAVHAYSELRFPLPKSANAFRSRIGLDRVVGPGGCVRGRVYVGSTRGKPAYESPLLIGSKKTVDTGRVRLELPPEGPGLLVLQADPVDRGAPDGADPLNIRDKLDWLDPRLELDKARLQEQVRLQIGPLLAASPGWTLRLDRRGEYTWTTHFDADEKVEPGDRAFRMMLQTGGQPLSLRREMTIGPADKWLAVHLGLPTGENPRGDTVTLRVGDRKIQPRKIPLRQLWQTRPAPLVFPLAQYQGRKIVLELTQPAGGKPLHWQSVNTSDVPPAAYRLVDIMKLVGKGDMKVPYELGQALQSKRIGKGEKLAALELTALGGIVNFMPSMAGDVPVDTLANVLVGRDWSGGEKAFIKALATFKNMPSLESLLVTEESGVSDGVLAKFRAELPKLKISRFVKRVPSPRQGAHRGVTWRNHCTKEVRILWIDQKGELNFSITRFLSAGQELKRSAYVGIRYEAHYSRKDSTDPKDYILSQPVSTFQVTPDGVWDIKRGRKLKP
jgi:hypothetical protein